MKLSAVLALSSSVARAQYDDLLADLNLAEFGLNLADYGITPEDLAAQLSGNEAEAALDNALAESAVAAELAGERYFGTTASGTVTTTTTTTTTTAYSKSGCFKCDQMSMAECAALGQFESCPSGEQSVCFLEIREVNQQVNQLCTGCKNTQACHELQNQNFIGEQRHMHQCRPHYVQQKPTVRSPNGQSTCRQCFKQCEFESTVSTDGMCFFGHDDAFVEAGDNLKASGANDAGGNPFSGNRLIDYDQANLIGHTTVSDNADHPLNGYTLGTSTVGFGIPTGAKIADGHAGASSISNNQASVTTWNLYFASGTDAGNTGKVHPATGAMTAITGPNAATGKAQRQMAYWGIIGANRNWWSSDLIAIQNAAMAVVGDATPIIAVP